MRAIIPVAGSAQRLRPITDSKPKALIEVAGKPVLEHILDNLAQNGFNEIVLIVGHMKEVLIEWTQSRFGKRFHFHYVEQKELLGLGHAIIQAAEFLVDDEVLIMLGDEILSKNYSEMIRDCRTNPNVGASLGVMITDTPSRYGMVKLNDEGIITHMVEKPKEFDGNLALAGVYYFRSGKDIREALEVMLTKSANGAEYQITDAMQWMVEQGAIFNIFSADEGYDCGRPESLIISNRRMLANKHHVDPSAQIIDSEIIEPCFIGKNSKIVASKIGPFVSIGEAASITSSVISDSIIESSNEVENRQISHSIISLVASIHLDEEELATEVIISS